MSARPRRRRSRAPRLLALLVAAALVFVLGLSVGRALEDGPSEGEPVTVVRTLEPLPLPPARSTVTETVTAR